MKVQILIPKANQSAMYPLLKWRTQFKKKGLRLEITSRKDFTKKNIGDIVILTNKTYQSNYNSIKEYTENAFPAVVRDIEKIRSLGAKVIFYDLSDSSGSRELKLTGLVDAFLKKQVLKNKRLYQRPHHYYRPWLENKEEPFPGCATEDLNKIRTGWNLALTDYVNWIIPPKHFRLNLFKKPKRTTPDAPRKYVVSYRGSSKGSRAGQREKVKSVISSFSAKEYVTGPIVGKRTYKYELRHSKSIVSPFGYGEICYRDIEAFIYGAILIKPSIEHIDTFPSLFNPSETYLPIQWDISDLKEQLTNINNNYDSYIQVARNGQERFFSALEDFTMFYDHFNKILSTVV